MEAKIVKNPIFRILDIDNMVFTDVDIDFDFGD